MAGPNPFLEKTEGVPSFPTEPTTKDAILSAGIVIRPVGLFDKKLEQLPADLHIIILYYFIYKCNLSLFTINKQISPEQPPFG